MSHRSRSTGFSIVTAALILVLVALGATWVYDAGQSKGKAEGENIANSNAYSRHAQQEIKDRCLVADPVVSAECIRDVIQATNEHQRAEDDLEAQTEMALWAFGMLVVTVAMAVVTSVGVFFVWKTLKATQDMAADQANIGNAQVRASLAAIKTAQEANQIMRDELRPWLDITASPAGDVAFLPDSGTIAIPFHITIENRGRSPAFNVAVEVSLAAVPKRDRVSLGGEDQNSLNKRLIDNAVRRVKSKNYTVTVFPDKPHVMKKWNGHAHLLGDGVAEGESFGLIYSIVVAYGDGANPKFFSVLPGIILHGATGGLFAFTLSDIKDGITTIRWADVEAARLV